MSLPHREFTELLCWAAPRLRLRAAGFARVERQVRRRVARRIASLGLAGAGAYGALLSADPAEWAVLDGLCRVTISRFFRDAPAFAVVADRVLPELAARAAERPDRRVRAWSMACASGEEPYSLALAWQARVAARFPGVMLDLTATDASPGMVARAQRAEYPRSIFRELPGDLARLIDSGPLVTLPAAVREAVRFSVADVRDPLPPGPFDLLACRNLVFTYFAPDLQRAMLARMAEVTRPGGLLWIGKREALPDEHPGWATLPGAAGLFLRT